MCMLILCVCANAWRRHCGERPVGARRNGGNGKYIFNTYLFLFELRSASSLAHPSGERFPQTAGAVLSGSPFFFLFCKVLFGGRRRRTQRLEITHPRVIPDGRDETSFVCALVPLHPTCRESHPGGSKYGHVGNPAVSTSEAVARIGHSWPCLWEWKGVDPV